MRAAEGPSQASQLPEFHLDEVTVARRVMAERVRVFTDRAVAGALSSPLGTLLLVLVLGPAAGWGKAAAWLILINLDELLILGLGYRFRTLPPLWRDSIPWARRQIGANFLVGLAWGASVWFFAVEPLSHHFFFNLSVLVAVSAICVTIMSAFRTASILFSAAVLLPPVVHAFQTSHPFALQIGLSLIILFALEVQYGAVARRQLISGLDAAQRSQALVDQLSQLRSDLYQSNHALEQKNADLAAAFERLNELATHDELTGASNRRVMVERLELQVAYKSRYGTPASLIMLDLDHFKKINDRHGHSVGDLALQVLVRTVQGELREGDILARFGGEEFLILLPLSAADAARQTAERLRCAIAAIELAADQGRVRLRASFGVAELATGEVVADWLRRVDLALYQAKDSGRNRVVLADVHAPPDAMSG
ncbi:MAG: diguanylate cyclase [Rhodocyclales bacterium]|nr:diguanylate cyclase [Rhodocyclales bacterium]